jgi:hypothetical protein
MATPTRADVLKMREDVLAAAAKRREKLTPAQVLQGVRTLVHEQLQEADPMPYLVPAADAGMSHEDFLAAQQSTADPGEQRRLHDDEVRHMAERRVRMRMAVPESVHLDFEQARLAEPEKWRHIRDAHHWVQMKHTSAQWEQAFQIVAEAGVQ